jgi:hypothetical protein
LVSSINRGFIDAGRYMQVLNAIAKYFVIGATCVALSCGIDSGFKDNCEGMQGSALEACVSSAYGLGFDDYQALKANAYMQPASCQQRKKTTPAPQPPAPQDRSLEKGLTEIYFDECSAVYSTTAENPDDLVSVTASCKEITGDVAKIDFTLTNNDTNGFANMRGVITSLSDPSVSLQYPKGVTSTGCADANCPYFMVGDLGIGESVTTSVDVSNPQQTNYSFDVDFWGT